MNSQSSILIDSPIDDVFTAANEHMPRWSLTCVSDEVIEDKGGVGTTSAVKTCDRGREMDFICEVTGWNPPYLSAVHLAGPQFDIDTRFEFETTDGGTRITQVAEVHPRGAFKVFFTLFGWLFKKSSCDALNKELSSLKAYCETGATVR